MADGKLKRRFQAAAGLFLKRCFCRRLRARRRGDAGAMRDDGGRWLRENQPFKARLGPCVKVDVALSRHRQLLWRDRILDRGRLFMRLHARDGDIGVRETK